MSDSVKTFGLNIHIVSFHLPPDIFNESDDLRIGITTLPEHIKTNTYLPGSKISHANQIFTVNVQVPTREVKDLPSNATRKILVSFRKKGVFSNQMLGNSIVHAEDLPKIPEKADFTGVITGEIKRINIYEPVGKQIKEMRDCEQKGLLTTFEKTDHNTVRRKTIGYMEVQMSLCQPIEEEDKHSKTSLEHSSNSKLNSSSNASLKRSGSLKSKKRFSQMNNTDASYHHFD